jgi:hypothetical protein
VETTAPSGSTSIGLTQEDVLDGIEHYQAAGVSFPPNPRPFQLVVMRYRRADAN